MIDCHPTTLTSMPFLLDTVAQWELKKIDCVLTLSSTLPVLLQPPTAV